jgi:hypothetical protein
MDEERRSDLSSNNTTNINAKSNSPQTLAKTGDSSSVSNTNSQTNNVPTCVIDRNRMIKYASPIFQNQILNKPSRLMPNLNLFYELIKSMPELSNFEVR